MNSFRHCIIWSNCSEYSSISLLVASVTKCHRLSGLNSRNVFLTVLEADNPGYSSDGAVSGEGSLPGLKIAVFFVFTKPFLGVCPEHGNSLSSSL